ncbi:hypothetical protein F5887DRAFT_923079 [Amanita rubescens]|nr:hypothetical protein F5887DRAFT_923079 [Amanita rubescens]
MRGERRERRRGASGRLSSRTKIVQPQFSLGHKEQNDTLLSGEVRNLAVLVENLRLAWAALGRVGEAIPCCGSRLSDADWVEVGVWRRGGKRRAAVPAAERIEYADNLWRVMIGYWRARNAMTPTSLVDMTTTANPVQACHAESGVGGAPDSGRWYPRWRVILLVYKRCQVLKGAGRRTRDRRGKARQVGGGKLARTPISVCCYLVIWRCTFVSEDEEDGVADLGDAYGEDIALAMLRVKWQWGVGPWCRGVTDRAMARATPPLSSRSSGWAKALKHSPVS